MNRRQLLTAPKHTNRKMDEDTYALRRIVIGMIYDAKRVVNLPRIDVRITDPDSPNILGTARMKGNVIWIPASLLECNSEDIIRQTVYHELCHAVRGQKHVEGCLLMGSHFIKSTTKAQSTKLLIKYLG